MAADWSWSLAADAMPALLKGLVVTLQAITVGMAIALTVGLLWAILRRSPRRTISWPVTALVEFVRSTPLLVQIYFLFYFVRPMIGLDDLSPFVAGSAALGLHYSAYTAEVYRAGIDGVPRGQWEAARALGLSRGQTWRHVVLPQALPPVVPALGNYLIAIFKDAPLLSAIAVSEILLAASNFGSRHASYLEPLTIVGALYLVLSLVAGTAVSRLERRLGRVSGGTA